jgi:DNA-binding transcriptional LysR family regulator
MRLSLDALEVLDAIERNGSFAAAAEEIHRVPSAITYQIQKLEQDLDVLLFDRRGHRAQLTAAGRELLVNGRLLLRTAGDLEHRIKRIATGWEPELRISIDTIVPFAAVLPLVNRFDQYCTRQGATHTRLRLTNDVLGGTWDALVDGRADIAIGAPGEPPSGSRVRTRLLAAVEMVFAVSPQHALASAAEPLTAATLRQHRIVAVADTSRASRPRTIGVIEGQDTLTVPDMPGKLAAQIATLGCGWLPRFLVSPHITAGSLQVKRTDEARAAVPVYIAWTAERPGKALSWWLKTLEDGRWAAMLTR